MSMSKLYITVKRRSPDLLNPDQEVLKCFENLVQYTQHFTNLDSKISLCICFNHTLRNVDVTL